MTTAPGFTMSAVIAPATPIAAMRMSARRVNSGNAFVAVWQSVTVALARSFFCIRMPASGLPTMFERPQITTCLPAGGLPVRRSSSTMPAGVAGQVVGSPRSSLPRLVGVTPSASLAGSMAAMTASSRICFGSGSWTRMP